MLKQIAFIESDKYLVAKPYNAIAPFKPESTIKTSFCEFLPTGEFTIYAGFLFSASFPAINTFESRRAACVHDAMYELMKKGLLPRSYRQAVDQYFYDNLREDGMNILRAWYWHKAVRIGGDNALDSPSPKIQYSPVNPDSVPDINKHKGLV